jgi:hypothetical protein
MYQLQFARDKSVLINRKKLRKSRHKENRRFEARIILGFLLLISPATSKDITEYRLEKTRTSMAMKHIEFCVGC